MRDAFITAINTQKTTNEWMNMLVENMTNIYTPGYREMQGNFKTFLDGAIVEDTVIKTGQGKAVPGTSPENVFLEGDGYFVAKSNEGQMVYTRLGEFKFDAEGVYKTTDGKTVQGYILNDNGEIMGGSVPNASDPYTKTGIDGGPATMATTDIKMWIDPSNGKYLGKYEEFEIKDDGIIYGKANKGKVQVPLYKLAIMNFHNPESLTEVKQGQYIENKESGKPVMGRGTVKGGHLELSNCDFKANIAYYQQAKMQLEMVNKIISTNKSLLQEAMRLLQ